MPRQDAVWLNLQVSQEEKDILTEYAHSNRKSRVEVVREFIRGLLDTPDAIGTDLHQAFPDEYPTWGSSLAKKLSTFSADRYKKIQARIQELVEEEYRGKQHEKWLEDEGVQFIRGLQPGEKTSVGSEEQKFLRSMSSTKPGTGVYFIEEHYRPKAISPEEVREWLQSLGAEADQELADAASLRAMAAHMLTIAERLEK